LWAPFYFVSTRYALQAMGFWRWCNYANKESAANKPLLLNMDETSVALRPLAGPGAVATELRKPGSRAVDAASLQEMRMRCSLLCTILCGYKYPTTPTPGAADERQDLRQEACHPPFEGQPDHVDAEECMGLASNFKKICELTGLTVAACCSWPRLFIAPGLRAVSPAR